MWGAAVFAWAMAALFIRVPEQPIPQVGETVGALEEWVKACRHFHDSVQHDLQTIYSVLAAAAAFAWVVGNFVHLGIRYAEASLLIAIAMVAAGIPWAMWRERVLRGHLQRALDSLGQPPPLF